MYIAKIQNWRKNKTVIYSGKLMHFVPEDGIYTYFRYNDDEKVMVILNKNDEAKKLSTKRFSEVMGNCKNGFDIISSKEISSLFEIIIPSKAAMVIELQQ